MLDEQALICRIIADPSDIDLRLIYADWLDDQSDPRGEYLRLLLALQDETQPEDARTAWFARLDELRPSLRPKWLASMHRGQHLHRTIDKLESTPRRRPIPVKLEEAIVDSRRNGRESDPVYALTHQLRRLHRMSAREIDRLVWGDE